MLLSQEVDIRQSHVTWIHYSFQMDAYTIYGYFRQSAGVIVRVVT